MGKRPLVPHRVGVGALALAALVGLGVPAAESHAGVTPPSITASLHPGESTSAQANVDVTLPPKLDVAWLVDTTGDTTGTLTALKNGASMFWDDLYAAAPDAQI